VNFDDNHRVDADWFLVLLLAKRRVMLVGIYVAQLNP
jgi:hypothetical protein